MSPEEIIADKRRRIRRIAEATNRPFHRVTFGNEGDS